MPVANTNSSSDSEIKSAQYQVALNSSKSNSTFKNDNLSDVGTILDTELTQNKKEPWCKLNQTEKVQKLNEFAKKMGKDKNLSQKEIKHLQTYLSTALSRKKLQKVKDVLYDKETGIIKSIPTLNFNSTEKRFTLKRSDRRTCTTKSLGLGKTRKRGVTDKIDTQS